MTPTRRWWRSTSADARSGSAPCTPTAGPASRGPRSSAGGAEPVCEQAIFDAEQASFDVSTGVFAVGIGMVGPTLIAHGSQQQKDRYLGPLLRGEEIWCQLFSEPGAGSDLAGLSTKAVLDGDEWVVDGQKVWTSGAQHSDMAILLARTDTSVPKHAGITYFVVDMATPGIDVRPLRQINGSLALQRGVPLRSPHPGRQHRGGGR